MKSKATAHRQSLRIIGGSLRSRKIEFSDSDGLRPTPDRVRETLFNWLQADIPGSHCLDLFAGTGALGFEALSRGATSLVMVERNPEASRNIAANIARLQCPRADLVQDDALHWLGRRSRELPGFDVVFIDPPFAAADYAAICDALNQSGCLHRNSVIYLESAQPIAAADVPSTWVETKAKKAGNVHYALYRNQGEQNDR